MSSKMGEEAVNKRVGILTWHYNNNFGSTLQAFALQEALKKIGYNPIFLNYRKKEKPDEKYKNMVRLLRSYYLEMAGKDEAEQLRYGFLRFRKKYFKQGMYVYDNKNLGKECKKCFAVICGSDQIWAPNVFDPTYFLNFVPKGVKKISYAASIGLPAIPNHLVPQYTELLNDFNAISVRELAGKELLNRQCGIEAECVLDPTLLLDKNEWEQFEREKYVPDYKYIFCYFLNADNNYSAIVNEYKKRLGFRVICISADNKNAEEADLFLSGIGPDDFLSLIHNAQMVITDSFHGTVFSINYGINFATLLRFSEEDNLCQNYRIYNILKIMKMDEHIISSVSDIPKCCAGVEACEKQEILMKERKKSMDYLIKALRQSLD